VNNAINMQDSDLLNLIARLSVGFTGFALEQRARKARVTAPLHAAGAQAGQGSESLLTATQYPDIND
jgi:hypothetical protein